MVAGKSVKVREALVYREGQADKKLRSYGMVCPICGKDIIRIRMPNSGAAFFEGKGGLSRVKHPCFTIGRGLSRRRDEDTLDMFEQDSSEEPEGSE
jgi:hypothetical protein